MSTELIAKNDVSKDLNAKLKEAGKSIDDKMIDALEANAETRRVDYQSHCLLLGVAHLAMQEAVGRKAYKLWFEKRQRRCQNCETARSIRVYRQLARRFLSDLETGKLREQLGEAGVAGLDTQIVVSTELFMPTKQEAIIEYLRRFTAGRSLRQMLADFAAANQDATAEIAEELKTKQLAGAQAAGGEDPKTGQFDFLGSLEKDFSPAVQTFETALDSPAWIRDDVSNEDKLSAITSLRDRIKSLDTKLADKAKALKQGQAA